MKSTLLLAAFTYLSSLRESYHFPPFDAFCLLFLEQMAILQFCWIPLLMLILCSHKPCLLASSLKFHHQETPSIEYTYDRFREVEDKCGPLISSRSELAPDDARGWRIKEELSFTNGDWSQDPGPAPLMPFQDYQNDYPGKENILKLASFQVVDVDRVRRMRDAVSISGVLNLAIGRGIQYMSLHFKSWSPEFYMQPGHSRLTIVFEGVYAESEGEWLMCLLGTAKMLNRRHPFIDSPMEPMEGLGQSYGDQARALNPSLLQDDQIILVVKYPKAFTLTGRGIWGEMRSLNERSDIRHFDRVGISSLLTGGHLKYQFGTKELLKRACDPYPYRDKSLAEEEQLAALFTGDSFCNDLQQFVFNVIFNAVPGNGRINKDQESDPFGFKLDCERLSLLIQDLRCSSRSDQSEMTANVSAVFRIFPSRENPEMSEFRAGLKGSLALSAEGTWRSSSGQLCMVAGIVELSSSIPDNCNYRISLYMARTFSLTHRSIVFGAISRIREMGGRRLDYHSSLRFEMPDICISPESNHWNGPNRSYKYSRILEASSLQKQRSPSVLGMLQRKFFLQYPTLNMGYLPSLSSLSAKLSLCVFADPQSPFTMDNRALFNLHVLSLGSFFSWYHENDPKVEKFLEKSYLEEGIPIAGHLSISGGSFAENMSISLAFEGLYSQASGKMSLVACRDMHSFQMVLTADSSLSLEGGKDCLVEAEIQYPPQNFGWLMNPAVKIFITSKRTHQDPLYFPPVNLRTPWTESRNRSDIMYREKFEATLQIFLLLVSILCIFSQLKYKAGSSSSGFLSLSMLGIQVIGYLVPFISGNEVLLKGAAFLLSPSYHLKDTAGFEFEKFSYLSSVIRILLLVAFLLTLRLSQKVWDSR